MRGRVAYFELSSEQTRLRSHYLSVEGYENPVIEKLAAKKLSLSPTADKRTLIRRATYDLLGLAPSAAEIDAYVSDASRSMAQE